MNALLARHRRIVWVAWLIAALLFLAVCNPLIYGVIVPLTAGLLVLAVAAAALYALYHVGYGMGAREMGFLFGLGLVYSIAYACVNNVLILWFR